jgi:8-oxo-dGTP diphosphatase
MSPKYVVGFAFSSNLQSVMLIKKVRPAWQAGKLNGIGGKVEPCELAVCSMVREFREESGLNTHDSHWHRFAQLQTSNGATVHCFYYVFRGPMPVVSSPTDEEVVVIKTDDLARHNIVANVAWMIPIALNHIRGLDRAELFDVMELPRTIG